MTVVQCCWYLLCECDCGGEGAATSHTNLRRMFNIVQVCTWMDDHKGRLGAGYLGPFVGEDLNL